MLHTLIGKRRKTSIRALSPFFLMKGKKLEIMCAGLILSCEEAVNNTGHISLNTCVLCRAFVRGCAH